MRATLPSSEKNPSILILSDILPDSLPIPTLCENSQRYYSARFATSIRHCISRRVSDSVTVPGRLCNDSAEFGDEELLFLAEHPTPQFLRTA